jgi:hypothetical protein
VELALAHQPHRTAPALRELLRLVDALPDRSADGA